MNISCEQMCDKKLWTKVGNRSCEKQDLGRKCSAWKVFDSKDFGLVDLYQKTKLDPFGSKKFGSENFLSQKKIFGQTKLYSE